MRIALVQHPPRLLDRAATLTLACTLVAEAAAGGAELVVFSEVFVPGYPTWIWRLRPGADMALADQLHARLLANAVDLSADDLAPLCAAAREHAVTVVCGIDERDGRYSRSTLYNAAVVIGPDGALLHRHRKLMPTNPERMVWGFGDGSTLRVVDTSVGRLGVLICWENYMPLARYAMYAQGVEIYVALSYDCGERWLASMQHIGREGGCWVLASGWACRAADLPDDLPGKAAMYPDPAEWINSGDAVVVAPGGRIAAGPLHQEFGILYADLDPALVGIARRSLDVAGHYARPDVFQLHVNGEVQRPVDFHHG
ncbi:carbon-nitrogen hydrolase family protein [Azoarcus sp. DD4]|uniref:carbon-nitrogen hydrolase family protein n=1 Tax=Azoarcus sp. DD4 TaxID=2027405 RepID=UPI00197AA271|nr:carbon-nitrogen hydrolase family protein [Azoarcus sp. DD4]